LIIVLLGTTAVHQTMVAAYLYLNKINEVDFGRIEGYGDITLDDEGAPILIGADEAGNQVYTMGIGGNIEIGYRAITEFLQVMSVPVDTMLVYPVRMPGETIIWLIAKISRIPWGVGSVLNLNITKLIINRCIDSIHSTTEDLRLQVENRLGTGQQ